MKILQGQRPDITPAQLVAVLIAGVPIVASLLSAFGVDDRTPAQEDALAETVQWSGLLAIGLLGADFGIRAARNHADATVNAGVPGSPAQPPAGPLPAPEPARPSNAEEFALAGPADGLAMFTGFTIGHNGHVDPGPDSRM